MNVDTLLCTLIIIANIAAAVVSAVSVFVDRRDPGAMLRSTMPWWAVALVVVTAVGFALMVLTKGLILTAIGAVIGAAIYGLSAVLLQRFIALRLARYGYRLA